MHLLPKLASTVAIAYTGSHYAVGALAHTPSCAHAKIEPPTCMMVGCAPPRSLSLALALRLEALFGSHCNNRAWLRERLARVGPVVSGDPFRGVNHCHAEFGHHIAIACA